MNLRRFMRPESICLELRTRAAPENTDAGEFETDGERNRRRVRESVLEELADLFIAGGAVANVSRFRRDLINREKKASTAVGHGIVVPHVRTLQAKSFSMVFGRSIEDLPYDTPDDEPVRLFFGLAAPPYDDRTYLKVYKSLAGILIDSGQVEEFLTVEEPSEILRLLQVLT